MTWGCHVADETGNVDFPFGGCRFGAEGARQQPERSQDRTNEKKDAQKEQPFNSSQHTYLSKVVYLVGDFRYKSDWVIVNTWLQANRQYKTIVIKGEGKEKLVEMDMSGCRFLRNKFHA